MGMKRIFILLVGILLATSCRSTYEVSILPDLEDAFIGRSYAEIIDALGAPDRLTPDGRGGQIMVFEELHLNTDGTMNPWTKKLSLVTESSRGYTHMYVNEDNLCYQVRTNREKEVSEFSLGKTIGLVGGIAAGITLILIASKSLNSK